MFNWIFSYRVVLIETLSGDNMENYFTNNGKMTDVSVTPIY